MAGVIGTGHFVPHQVITNHDLEKLMDTTDEWIVQRSGIKQRHWVRNSFDSGVNLSNSDLATKAAQNALSKANIAASEIDLVVYASITTDFDLPGAGNALISKLQLNQGTPVFEVRNQCSGFLYGMSIAKAYLDSGAVRNVLLIGAEVQSTGLDLSTRGRNTAVLFADGAGAVVLSNQTTTSKIISVKLQADGTYADKLCVRSPSFARDEIICAQDFEGESPAIYPYMDGKFVFKMASEKMPEMVKALCAEQSIPIDDLDLIVPHQANQRIIDMLGAAIAAPHKVFSNIAKYGNTTAASIPIAMNEACQQGLIQSGSLVCLVSFGAGFSWAGALIRF